MPEGGAWAAVAAGDAGRFYEVQCRGPSRCGTFVSVRRLEACPKCGSRKIAARAAEPLRAPPASGDAKG